MARLLLLDDLPIRVTRRGAWLHGSEPLHPRVAALFRRNIVPRGDHYIVKLGFNEQRLEVEDTPFAVQRVELEQRDGSLASVRLFLSDESTELLDVHTLMQAEDNTLYCGIRRHGFFVPCRFSPAQYHELALHMRLEGDAALLEVGSEVGRVGSYEGVPRRLGGGT